MTGTFRIDGGVPLAGEVTPIPNKNALMGALPAAALAGGGITFKTLPDTLDVHTYLEILARLGADVMPAGDGAIHVDPTGIRAQAIDPAMGRRLRGAFALTGPLLARLGTVEMPLPGGCELGYRAVTAHLDGFRKLGVGVEQRDGSVLLTAPRRHEPHYDIWLVEASVSATLALALYTAGSGFSVTIRDPACEPHVVEVLGLLRHMGVGVEGEGTNRLTIHGPGKPLAAAEFEAGPDYVDIAGSITAAAVTGGELTIRGGNARHLIGGMEHWFRAFGVELEPSGDDLLVSAPEALSIQSELLPQAGPELPKLVVRPWPGFPVDVLPVMVTLACKSSGAMLFQNLDVRVRVRLRARTQPPGRGDPDLRSAPRHGARPGDQVPRRRDRRAQHHSGHQGAVPGGARRPGGDRDPRRRPAAPALPHHLRDLRAAGGAHRVRRSATGGTRERVTRRFRWTVPAATGMVGDAFLMASESLADQRHTIRPPLPSVARVGARLPACT